MTSKEELLASLIEQQKVLAEQSEAVEAICSEGNKVYHRTEGSNDNGQEYVYWARRGELETAGEVEVCSSTGNEQQEAGGEVLIVDESVQGNTEIVTSHEEEISHNVVSTINEQDLQHLQQIEHHYQQIQDNQGQSQHENSSSINVDNNSFSAIDLEHERRMEEKRETARLQEQIMNEEYQKAIGYLLCSSKSKSGKQKKKQTMTAYLFFCRRYRSKIVARNPKLSFAQISKILSHMWRNATEQEKNTYRMKLEQHRTKVNAIVEKNMIEKMKMVKQQKVMDEMRRRNEEADIQSQLDEIERGEREQVNQLTQQLDDEETQVEHGEDDEEEDENETEVVIENEAGSSHAEIDESDQMIAREIYVAET